MTDANRTRARAIVRDLCIAITVVALASACGGVGAPGAPPNAASPSDGASGVTRGGAPGGAVGGDDPATTPVDPEARAQRAQKADDCLKKCYQSPAAISGDALRDMCEKQCGSTGSGKVQPTPK